MRDTILILPTNRINLVTRSLAIPLTVALIYFLGKLVIQGSNNPVEVFKIGTFIFKSHYILFFVISGLCIFTFLLAASILEINKVLVDTARHSITFVYLYSEKTVLTDDITGYFETTHGNSLKTWDGLLVQIKHHETIQLAGQNIKSLQKLKAYLTSRDVTYLGKRKMKFPFN